MKNNVKKILIAGAAVATGVAGAILVKGKMNKKVVEEVVEEVK